MVYVGNVVFVLSYFESGIECVQNVCVIWKETCEYQLYVALLFAVTVHINMCSVEEIRRNLYFLWNVLTLNFILL